MKPTAEEIKNYAEKLGVSDIRFAEPGGKITVLAGELKGKTVELYDYLDGAKCLIVLFKSYLPTLEPEAGNISVSPYYIASNFIYHAANKIMQYIQENGGKAVRLTNISAREAALRTGGFIGDNGFYFHNELGSFVCIQTILTDTCEPVKYTQSEKHCFHCGKCKNSCPGVSDIDKCLRKHINGIIPETLRGSMYQLFGCEKCQAACLINSSEKSIPVEFSLKELLAGGGIEELKSLVGINNVRKNRILSYSVIYAANTDRYELAGQIKDLSVNLGEPVRSHALWALNKLEQRNR